MREQDDEAAFFAARVETSTALAFASTDSCARASHVGIAAAYGERLAKLTRADLPLEPKATASEE